MLWLLQVLVLSYTLHYFIVFLLIFEYVSPTLNFTVLSFFTQASLGLAYVLQPIILSALLFPFYAFILHPGPREKRHFDQLYI